MFENKVGPGDAIMMLDLKDGWNIAVGTPKLRKEF